MHTPTDRRKVLAGLEDGGPPVLPLKTKYKEIGRGECCAGCGATLGGGHNPHCPVEQSASAVVEVVLTPRRSLRVQRIGDDLRLSVGYMVERADTPAFGLVGSVLIPLKLFRQVLRAIAKVRRRRKPRRASR